MFANPQLTPEDQNDEQPAESVFESAKGMNAHQLLAIETAVNAMRQLHSLGEPECVPKNENASEYEVPGPVVFLENVVLQAELNKQTERLN